MKARLIALIAVAALVGLLAGTASAGGSWFYPVKDRYEPGDNVTLVGYSGGGSLGRFSDGPFFGYLGAPVDENYQALFEFDEIPLGEVDITRTDNLGYLTYRAAISFDLPDDLAPGLYRFDYCNEGCQKQFGDLIGGFVPVGIDREYEVRRDWAPDEPEIANLEPRARLTGPAIEDAAAASPISAELRQLGRWLRLVYVGLYST